MCINPQSFLWYTDLSPTSDLAALIIAHIHDCTSSIILSEDALTYEGVHLDGQMMSLF